MNIVAWWCTMKVKVAAAQMLVTDGANEKNLTRAERLLAEAVARDAQIIGFPEFFITGTVSGGLEDIAEPIPGPLVDRFGRLAREHGIFVVMGSIYERSHGRYYNSSVILDDHGDVVGVYRKNKPWVSEREHITAGRARPVFSTRLGHIGLMICWDLAFPEVARMLAKHGAEIIYCPVHWATTDFSDPPFSSQVLREKSNWWIERMLVNSLVPARAIENGVILVLINGAGVTGLGEGSGRFVEGTQVAVPFYGTISRADGETVLVTEVDTQLVGIAQTKYRFMKDAD